MTKTTIIYVVMMEEIVVTMTMPIGMCLVHFVNALKAFANPLMVCNLKLFQLTRVDIAMIYPWPIFLFNDFAFN